MQWLSLLKHAARTSLGSPIPSFRFFRTQPAAGPKRFAVNSAASVRGMIPTLHSRSTLTRATIYTLAAKLANDRGSERLLQAELRERHGLSVRFHRRGGARNFNRFRNQRTIKRLKAKTKCSCQCRKRKSEWQLYEKNLARCRSNEVQKRGLQIKCIMEPKGLPTVDFGLLRIFSDTHRLRESLPTNHQLRGRLQLIGEDVKGLMQEINQRSLPGKSPRFATFVR